MELTRGYKQTKAGMIPDDWDVAKLGQRCTTGSGTTPSRALAERYYKNGSVHWVKTLDLNNSDICNTDELVTNAAIKETSLKVYPTGTVLIAMYGGFLQIGRTGILKIPAAVNQAITAIQANDDQLDPHFLLFTLNYRVDYWKKVASSSRKDPNITSVEIKNFPIAVPRPAEQHAIATALGDVDRQLFMLERLIAKKRDLKQAAMQQLLTGQARLPGFHGEWTKNRMESLASVDPENLPTSTPPLYRFNYISLEQVDAGQLLGFSEQVFRTAPLRARRVLRHDDVLLSTVRPNLMAHLHYRSQVPNAVCSTGFAVLRARPGIASSGFLFAHLFGYAVNGQIEKLLAGSNYPAINSRDVRLLELPCPPTIEEQEAIAGVVSDMDAELAALEQRRDKTRNLKQAMMQELLTGRTRLVPAGAADA